MSRENRPIRHAGVALTAAGTLPWWLGETLTLDAGRLAIGNIPVEALADKYGTPLYVYHAGDVRNKLQTLRHALDSHGLTSRIYYALKANRFAPLVAVLRADGNIGIDACSPREVQHALDAGFSPSEISVTASCLTRRDLAFFASSGCHLNLDTLSAIDRYAALSPTCSRIGIRIDTGVEIGYGINDKTSYSGGKLGLLPDDLDEAIQLATKGGLIVDTIHTHLGWGLRASDEAHVSRAFQRIADLALNIPDLTEINVGGGLGGKLIGSDEPLEPDRWAHLIAQACGHLPVTIACEPGTFLVAEAGALIVEVASTWDKLGTHWAGIDANFGTNLYPAHYSLPLEIISARDPLADADRVYSIAGNVNEAGDVFARDRSLPVLVEGEFLVLFPVGAYGSSMASDHCLRGNLTEVLI